MLISILCSDGSPLGVSVSDIYGKGKRGIGIGGSEIALLTMCEQWHKEGHEVVLYNNPTSNGSPFEQRNIAEFRTDDSPDVLIVFRSPNPRGLVSRAKKVIWWSCDQYTQGDFRNFADALAPRKRYSIVCISSCHAEYFAHNYGITNTTVIDLPIRVDDFKFEDERVKNRYIFTSVPDRGLDHLWAMWPTIKRDIPDASLVITSDYRLWGIPDPRNKAHRVKWMTHPDIRFRGALPRDEYLKELCQADMFLYPCDYEELACISAMEAQYAGAYPITSEYGALITTNMGTKISGDPTRVDFVESFIDAVKYWNDNRDELELARSEVQKKAYERFHPDIISAQWSKLFYE